MDDQEIDMKPLSYCYDEVIEMKMVVQMSLFVDDEMDARVKLAPHLSIKEAKMKQLTLVKSHMHNHISLHSSKTILPNWENNFQNCSVANSSITFIASCIWISQKVVSPNINDNFQLLECTSKF